MTIVGAGDPGLQPRRSRRRLTVGGAAGGVEREVEQEPAPFLRRLDAHAAEARQPHRSRLDHAHGAPEPSGVPVRVEVVPMGEDAGDEALGGPVRLARARDLHREHVVAFPIDVSR